jgi:hypothetical protein
MCKNVSVPQQVVQFINDNTKHYGTVKFYLERIKLEKQEAFGYFLDIEEDTYNVLRRKIP